MAIVVLVALLGAGAIALYVHGGHFAATTAAAQTGTSPRSPTSTSERPPPGRYQQPPNCAQLNNGSITFQQDGPIEDTGSSLDESCQETSSSGDPYPTVLIRIYTGPDGVGAASSIVDIEGRPLDGTDFENPPAIEYLEGACFIAYSRSNEYVKLGIPGGDPNACQSAGLRYAEQYYPLIG